MGAICISYENRNSNDNTNELSFPSTNPAPTIEGHVAERFMTGEYGNNNGDFAINPFLSGATNTADIYPGLITINESEQQVSETK